jgi:hypothetical protein
MGRRGFVLLLVAVLAGCVGVASETTSNQGPGGSGPAFLEPATSSAASASTNPGLSPSTTPSIPAAVEFDPAPLGSLGWHFLDTIPVADVRGLVGFSMGYVALTGPRTVWFSRDGNTWQKVDLPFAVTTDRYGPALDADASSLTTDGTQVLVVGGYAHATCDTPPPPGQDTTGDGPTCPLAPVSWISIDGLTWERSRPITPELPGKSVFTSAWPVPTGGWDAAACSWSGELCAGRALLHSADGLTWTSLPPAPDPVFERSDGVWEHAGVAGATGRRVLWEGSHVFDPASCDDSGGCTESRFVTTLWTSPDARTWQPVPRFEDRSAQVVAGAAAGGSSPWVLVGWTDSSGTSSVQQPAVWSSPDGLSWTRRVLPTPSGSPVTRATGFVRATVGDVAVGASNGGSIGHETWLSRDGLTWTRLPSPTATGPDYGPFLVAEGPAGVIGVSARPVMDGFESAVWQLR